MNKHRYQARELQRVDWGQLGEAVRGQRLIFAVDVAKTSFYGVLMSGAREALVTVRWQHPTETLALSELLGALPAARIEVALEPSGTYGDSLGETGDVPRSSRSATDRPRLCVRPKRAQCGSRDRRVERVIPRFVRPAEEDDCKSSIPGCCRFATIAIGYRSASPACDPSAWGPAHRRVVFAPSTFVARDAERHGQA